MEILSPDKTSKILNKEFQLQSLQTDTKMKKERIESPSISSKPHTSSAVKLDAKIRSPITQVTSEKKEIKDLTVDGKVMGG